MDAAEFAKRLLHRWFQHFYVVGIAANASLLVLLCRKVFWGEPWPLLLSSLLEYLQYPVSYTGTVTPDWDLNILCVVGWDGWVVCCIAQLCI